MNTDYRIKIGFFRHIKTRKLKKRFGESGIIALLMLWDYATEFRANGDLSGLSANDLEMIIDWTGSESLIAGLLDIGFLDGQDGDYQLHDWKDHNPWAADSEDRSDAARLSRLARKNPKAAKTLRDQGITGITQEEYRKYDRSTTVVRPYNDRSTERSTERSTPSPAPAPSPAPTPTVVSCSNSSASAHETPSSKTRHDTVAEALIESEITQPPIAQPEDAAVTLLEAEQQPIAENWQPSPDIIAALEASHIPVSFTLDCVAHFRTYHLEAGTRRRGYNSLFIGWVKRDFGRQPVQNRTESGEPIYQSRQEAKMTLIEWQQYLGRRFDHKASKCLPEPLSCEVIGYAH